MKKYISIIFVLLMMFVGGMDVRSITEFPDTIKVTKSGKILNLISDNDGKLIVAEYDKESDVGNASYAYFPIKYTEEGIALCTSNIMSIPGENVICEKTNFNTPQEAIGVAYIINFVNRIDDDSISSSDKYWWREFLIKSYLGKYNYDQNSFTYTNIINSSTFILGTDQTYSSIITAASTEASKGYEKITLSANKTSLTFTDGNDGFYYSNELEVTSNGTYKIELSNDNFTYTKTGNKFIFKIKKSDVTMGTAENLTITVSSNSPDYYVAQNYYCGEGVQTLTLAQTKKITIPDVKITAKVVRDKTSIKVAKVDSKDKLIKDAELVFQTEADYKAKKETQKIKTTESYITIDDLVAGKYYLSEKTAPVGYDKSDKVLLIEISNDGTIKVDGVASNGTIKYSNDLTKTTISKKDATGKSELPGATLHVLDKDKKSMSCTIMKDGKEQKLDKCTWVSGTKPVEIVGLAAGKYYLKETIAPDRYVINEEIVDFEVKADGSITNVEMKNKLNKVVISKVNAFNKKELPGATLELQNEKGEIVKYCSDLEKNSECKWVSTEKPYEIEGLPNGTYYLVETIAPKGFVLSKEKVKFTIDGKTAISYVQMTNELEVEVPDTLSSRSTLLVVISMFDIALGIGIINYVKKNKYQE